ncbi:DUF6571 family protein [Streptomyces hoynatensis]|uniref:DUF6571 domain-containing protein n=1 Tax=Streptomyces hoynatensis TaxID=1141874 RepID=A0A3A9ZGD6_9ACTN|nr:DUF6571 family protein [Streptomyces hoynatensis]RKN47135.1 hypothetical protein D7294_02885 [Streptomyces hoynatensis]
MPTYEELSQLTFANLDAAIGDWERTVRDLDDLAGEAGEGMQAKAAEADWAGETADVSREFINLTSTRFSYAHDQAVAIHGVLRDLAEALRRYQGELQGIEDDARAAGLRVRADGRLIVAEPAGPYSPEYLDGLNAPGEPLLGTPGQPTGQQLEAVEALAARIEEVLARAAETDETAGRALRDIVGGRHRDHFAPPGITGLDDAARRQGEADARAALALIESGDYETEEGLSALNDLLDAQKDNEYFGVYLADHLGAEGTLRFWAGLRDLESVYQPGESFQELLLSTRDNLGVALGTATGTENDRLRPRMETWMADLIGDVDHPEDDIGLGMTRFVGDSGLALYGFQVMGDILSHGEYDPGFLARYGHQLVYADRELVPETRLWSPASGMHHIIGTDFHFDPMTGFLTALSNSPDGATEFFNASDGANVTYLLTGREHLDYDAEVSPDGSRLSLDALGDALTAAATGMNPHDPTAEFAEHDAEHLAVARKVLEVESGLENRLPAELRDSAATMLGNYRSEVYETAGNSSDNATPLDPRHLSTLSTQIARSPEAYQILQQSMMVEYAEQIQADTSGNPDFTLTTIGNSVGFLEHGRFVALDIDKNNPQWVGQNVYNTAGYLAGEIPVAGPHIQNLVDQLSNRWLAHENQVIEQGLQESRVDYYGEENNYLNELANQWLRMNPDPPEYMTGVNGHQWGDRVHEALRSGTNDGQIAAAGQTGEQGAFSQ